MTNKEYANILIEELKSDELFDGAAFAYMAGRFPRISVHRAFAILQEARRITIDMIERGEQYGKNL